MSPPRGAPEIDGIGADNRAADGSHRTADQRATERAAACGSPNDRARAGPQQTAGDRAIAGAVAASRQTDRRDAQDHYECDAVFHDRPFMPRWAASMDGGS